MCGKSAAVQPLAWAAASGATSRTAAATAVAAGSHTRHQGGVEADAAVGAL